MKKIIIGIALFFVAITAVVFILPSFIDWSKYRAEITQQVEAATGRAFTIGGDIAFSILPAPILWVNDVHLGNAKGGNAETMVSVRELKAEVYLLPLLSGEVHIKSVHLIEPVINLEVLANTKPNWIFEKEGEVKEDVFTTPRTSDNPAFVDNVQKSDNALPLAVDDFFIENGQLSYFDHTRQHREVIENINSRFAVAGLQGPFEAQGTLFYNGVNLGFEGSIGEIVHGRTATFASEIRLPYGQTQLRLNGTYIEVVDGPKLKGTINGTGTSLAGLIGGFGKQDTLPGGLDQEFAIQGDFLASKNLIDFGQDGLKVRLGEDRASLEVRVEEEAGLQKLDVEFSFAKIDLQEWHDKAPYQVTQTAPLPLVIPVSEKTITRSNSRVSSALNVTTKESESVVKASETVELPKNIMAEVRLKGDAVVYNGAAFRQLQANLFLDQGELVLESANALLPGAGEVSIVGVASQEKGQMQFDGSLEMTLADMRSILTPFDIDVSAVNAHKLQNLQVKSGFSITPADFRLNGLVVKLDDMTLKGALAYLLQERPSFGVSLALDHLDVNSYVPLDAKEASGLNSDGDKTERNSDSRNVSPSVNPFAALDVLQSFDANVDLSINRLVYSGERFDQVAVKTRIYQGDVTIEQLRLEQKDKVNAALKGRLVRKEGTYQADHLNLKVNAQSLYPFRDLLGNPTINLQNLGAVSVDGVVNGALLKPDVNVTLNAAGAQVFASGDLDLFPLPKGEFSVSFDSPDLAKTLQKFDVAYRPSKQTALTLNSDVAYGINLVDLKNITGQLNQNSFEGDMRLQLEARPILTLNVKSPQLDLTSLKPKETPPTGTTNSQKQSTAQAGTTSGSRWSHETLDLNALNGFDADVALEAKTLIFEESRLENLFVDASLKNGLLTLKRLNSSVYGGTIDFKGSLNAQNDNALSINGDLQKINLAQASRGLQSNSVVLGAAQAVVSLSSHGKSEYDLIENLKGQIDTNLSSVTLQNKKQGAQGSLVSILNLLATLSGSDPKKGLADIAMMVPVEKGVARLQSATMTSPIAKGTATGEVSLPNWAIDVSGNLDLQPTAFSALLVDKANLKQSYPFAIKGDLSAPNVKLDSGGISSGGGLVIPLSDKLEKKGYGGLIRGILGANGVNVEQPTEEAPLQNGGETPPPPPPPNTSNQSAPPSVEQQLLRGLGTLLQKR